MNVKSPRYPQSITLEDGSKWVSYCSFDGDQFFIPSSFWGRDYLSREDAECSANLKDFDGHIASARTCTGEEITNEELQYALGLD